MAALFEQITFQKNVKPLFITSFSTWEPRMQALKEGGAHFSLPAGGEGQARPATYISPAATGSTWMLRNTGGRSPTPNTVTSGVR